MLTLSRTIAPIRSIERRIVQRNFIAHRSFAALSKTPSFQSRQTSRQNFSKGFLKRSKHNSAADMSPHDNSKFLINSLYDVKGRVAIVTGGGSGIGLMCTQALAANGAKVYITGRTKEKLETVVGTHGKDVSGKIMPLQADVTSKDEIERLVTEIGHRESKVDILINNAGIAGSTFQTEAKDATEMKRNLFDDPKATFQEWDDVYRTNVAQCYFMTLGFLPLLEKGSQSEAGWSSTVLNITSISGAVKSAQHHFQYNASKAAAIHLTTMLASELASNKIKVRVNSIMPGVYPSEMTTSDSDDRQKSQIEKEKFEGKVPADRPGQDRDMGNAVLFAITNTYLNGQSIPVDGGYIIQHGAGFP